jgi:hypothetical protein
MLFITWGRRYKRERYAMGEMPTRLFERAQRSIPRMRQLQFQRLVSNFDRSKKGVKLLVPLKSLEAEITSLERRTLGRKKAPALVRQIQSKWLEWNRHAVAYMEALIAYAKKKGAFKSVIREMELELESHRFHSR